MKKISLYAAGLLVVGLGATSCDELHNDLRLDPPTNYVLETPSNVDQLIIFGFTDSNVNNQWDVVTSNPYNITTEVDFQVQVARSEEDFLTWDNLVNEEGSSDSDYNYTNSEGLPYVVTINQIFTSPSFTLDGSSFCSAINEVYGLEEEFDSEVVEVAYRVHAWVPNVGYSSIFSNVVTLKQVQTYDPGKEPKRIYLIGQPQGWSITNGDMYAEETEIGSNIYKNTFYIGAGQFQFRFYSELGDWEANSIGAQDEDNPVNIEFTDDVYEGPVVVYNAAEGILGKGSWQNNAWGGGTVEVTVNLNTYTISMIAHEGADAPDTPVVPEGNVLYLIGQPQGWNISASDMYASETSKGSNIYKGTFEINQGDFQFRFYSALGDWETNSVGSQNEDASVDIQFTDGVYTGPVVKYDEAEGLLGKGNWQDTSWEGGWVEVVIDLNDLKITMTKVEAPAQKVDIYLRGGMNDWGADEAYQFSATADENVWVIENVTIASGVEFKIADSTWGTLDLGATEEGAEQNITPGQEKTLLYQGKNLIMSEAFTGKVTLTLTGDTYTVLLTSN